MPIGLNSAPMVLYSRCWGIHHLFVDFAKEFDRVDHSLLVTKFLAKGVPHCLVKWLYSYLSNCRQSPFG